ncbi:MAG: dihydroneopterin aldolase [Myxococcales bacterium]|nr:dihydroneopterin aldolase [Myxococcales bacterium]
MRFDTISVHGLELTGRHGVYDEERAEGRRFSVDVEADVVAGSVGAGDALAATLDYRRLAAIVVQHLNGPSVHLIESLAEAIARDALAEPAAARVRVRIRKFATGVPGDPAWVGFAIERTRGEPHSAPC